MEHTYTHRKNAWSAREHRLLFFETPRADPGVNESADNANVNVEALVQKVREISTKLEEQAGTRAPDNRTEEAKLQGRMCEISHIFNTKSAKLIDAMNTHRTLRAKAAGVLVQLLNHTEKQMLDAQREGEQIAADRKKDAEDIVAAQREEVIEQKGLYDTEREAANKSTDPSGRAVEYAEDEARATIEQIRALADSIDMLLPLTSDKAEKAKLTKEREQLIVDEITIFAELAGLQQKRRDTLKLLAEDENAPKTAVDERLDAASEQLQRAAFAREQANAAALKQGISRTTYKALTRKADTLFDSMAEVHREKTQIASDAHDQGKISLDDFTSVLGEEIKFLETYDRKEAVGFRLSLDKLVINKAVNMVVKANGERDIDKKKAARGEAVRFIDSPFGRASIQEGKRSSLKQTISNAERAEVEAAVTEKQSAADQHRVDQTVAAQELLKEDPIVDLHVFIEEAGTVLAEENLGQYLNEDEYTGITDVAKKLAEKVVTQIEADITSLDSKVEDLYAAATKGKTVPEKFEVTLGEVTRVSNNVELYNGSPLAQLKKVDTKKIDSMGSYRRCFVDIVIDYVQLPAITAKNAAKDAQTFREAFNAVNSAERIIGANSDNLRALLGTSFETIFAIKIELEEKLQRAINHSINAREKTELLQIQVENQGEGNPSRKVQLLLLIESEKERALKEGQDAVVGSQMEDLRAALEVVDDAEVLAKLETWLSSVSTLDTNNSSYNTATRVQGQSYRDRYGNSCVGPTTYGPTYRTQVQGYIRSQLQKTIPSLQEQHKNTPLTQRIADVSRKLQLELIRWMTPDQILEETRKEWTNERKAIDRAVQSIVENLDDAERFKRKKEAASTLRDNLNQDLLSVRNKLAPKGIIPDTTVGKSTLLKEVDKKYAELDMALDHAEKTLQMVDEIRRNQGSLDRVPAPPSEPSPSLPNFDPPSPPAEGNGSSTIQ